MASNFIKNGHFLLILGTKPYFSKRPLKRCILTLFLGFFGPKIKKKFQLQRISDQLG